MRNGGLCSILFGGRRIDQCQLAIVNFATGLLVAEWEGGMLGIDTVVGELVKDRIDQELIEVDGVSGLDGLRAPEDFVESRVFGDSFEGLVDSHASCQGLEIEMREDLHEQLVREVVEVRHV